MPDDHKMPLERSAAEQNAERQHRDHIAAGLAKQKEILMAMTAEQKLKIAFAMRRTAMGLKTAWLKQIHPDWSEQEVQAEVRRIFLNART